jgi:hypothetical protein
MAEQRLERTLTANHREALGQLEAHLIRNFDFQLSVVEPYREKQAVFIEGGHYRRPLTVTVYYVTAADEQERIASLIADFLEAFELNQCRVRIFQAEARTTWSTPRERISGGRGEEMLLREIFQNC